MGTAYLFDAGGEEMVGLLLRRCSGHGLAEVLMAWSAKNLKKIRIHPHFRLKNGGGGKKSVVSTVDKEMGARIILGLL